METLKKYFLPVFNILLPIILFLILLLADLSEKIMYLMIMTLLVGWIIPYLVLLITGASLINLKKVKLTLVFNILNILLCTMILILGITIYESKLLIPIVEYIIMLLTSLVNVIYLVIYQKNNKQVKKEDKESKKIKQIKKENNGAIL